MIEFKIADIADQKFATVLNNRRVSIRLRYNPTNDRWSFDLAIDDQPVLHGRRIVTGVDLLRAFDFDIGVIFAASITAGAKPGRAQLPLGTVKVFHTTQAEIDATISA